MTYILMKNQFKKHFSYNCSKYKLKQLLYSYSKYMILLRAKKRHLSQGFPKWAILPHGEASTKMSPRWRFCR